MKRLLIALALVTLPAVASAKPQTITLVSDLTPDGKPSWYVLDSDPPIQGGFSGPMLSMSKQVADALSTLTFFPNPQFYTCKATAFLAANAVFATDTPQITYIGVSSLNVKSCLH
jgi:hypothetical protein